MIDDIKDVADFVAMNCQKLGLSVSTAHTFDEAEKLILENNYDAVLADLFLDEGNDGEKLLTLYKKRNPSGISIAFTGHDKYHLNTEPDKFLRKPISGEDLEDALKGIIDKNDDRICKLVQTQIEPVILIIKSNTRRVEKLEERDNVIEGKLKTIEERLDMMITTTTHFIETNGKYGPILLWVMIGSVLVKLAVDFLF